jgi:hypothetical protein
MNAEGSDLLIRVTGCRSWYSFAPEAGVVTVEKGGKGLARF